MTSRRAEKMAELLRETITEIILRHGKDPRLAKMSLTGVRVSGDLKHATVAYAVVGGEADKAEVARALAKGVAFIRRSVGETLSLRFVPELKFEFDRNLEYARHMEELLGSLGQDDA